MRRDPFGDIERLFEEMRPTGERGERRTAVDVAEEDEEFTITVDLPGFDRDDIDLRIADNVLHLSAEHETEHEAEEAEYLRKERSRRSVSRSVRLPADVEEEAAEATYQNGVLTVTVPKSAADHHEGHRIDVD